MSEPNPYEAPATDRVPAVPTATQQGQPVRLYQLIFNYWALLFASREHLLYRQYCDWIRAARSEAPVPATLDEARAQWTELGKTPSPLAGERDVQERQLVVASRLIVVYMIGFLNVFPVVVAGGYLFWSLQDSPSAIRLAGHIVGCLLALPGLSWIGLAIQPLFYRPLQAVLGRVLERVGRSGEPTMTKPGAPSS